jgi:hypothetical protein
MDFIRIIRSLEELLYEVMTWLVFYPRTMWRIVATPGRMMRYSDVEQADAPDRQYTDTLSPPLFLMLTILIGHGIGLGLGIEKPEATTAMAKTLFESEQNRLIVASLLFSLFALMGATTAVARRGLTLDRSTLRGPFYSQCYLTAPFALAMAVASSLATLPARGTGLAAAAVALAGAVWYLWVETMWFGLELDLGGGQAFLVAAWAFLKAAFVSLVCLVVLALLLR